MDKFAEIFNEIKMDSQNEKYTKQGIDPIYMVNKNAKIVIISQAPGKKTQQANQVWRDQSGVKLREWMGLNEDEFYNSQKIAVLSMDFYYPGKAKSGDLPPRKDFAKKWHEKILALMPEVELFILVGKYAQNYYLNIPNKTSLTTTVKNYEQYLPKYLPIVHPSPLTLGWLKKNPWFESDVLPILRKKVTQIMKNENNV